MLKKTFSLIELLIVVAILSMIVALLMPSLNKAKESAMKLNCKNTTRSSAQSWHLYVEDNEYHLFQYVSHNRKIWTAHFKDYLESPDLLICPSTKVPKNIPNNSYLMGSATMAWAENRNYSRPIKNWNRSSYTYNINLSPGNPYNTNAYKYLSEITDTAGTPILGDGWWRAPGRMYNHLTRYIPQNLDDPRNGSRGGNSADRWITNRHGNQTILTYVDGHSEAVYLEEVFSQNWYKGYDTSLPVSHY